MGTGQWREGTSQREHANSLYAPFMRPRGGSWYASCVPMPTWTDQSPAQRPDPNELLARVTRRRGGGVDGSAHERDDSTSGTPRGTLKIFFGMAPGVGKTYAMLAAAQRLAAQGVDVVVGVVETHGRAETEQLLLGLDILPRATLEYRGATLHEFDAKAAIARRPDILLVDELAHTNAPGMTSGRAKRWQDVEACLAAGVNVYTTLNVQHLESINDVVAQITGVKVAETIPDHVFDEADQIELVDLPPDALHERLKAGKVYLAENAARAVDPSDGFFRTGNLTALRELALRRTAAWVDSELRRYKQDRGIRALWAAGERIVVAVSPSPMSAKLIRAAKRMAAGLHADLIAVYVQTSKVGPLSAEDKDRLAANMRLAESLGATTHTIAGASAAGALIAFARARNVGKIVVGKSLRPRWREVLAGSFVDRVIRESGDIDIYVVRGDEAADAAPTAQRVNAPRARAAKALGTYALAVAMVAAVTALGIVVFSGLERANVAMVYLAVVVVAALRLGRGPAMLAAATGVAAFDYCFVPPHWTFAVSDAEYLLTFGVMLAVGMVVGTLAARTREQTEEAWTREGATAAQYALSRELAAAREAGQVAAIVARHVHDALGADAVVCAPVRRASGAGHVGGATNLDVLAAAGLPDWFDDAAGRERGVAQWALDHSRPAGMGTNQLPSAAGRYIPLIGTDGALGVLGVRPRGDAGTVRAAGNAPATLDGAAVTVLDAIATQAASALERVRLSESEQAARLAAERERLRSALLSSVSHDLRTPLASITGAASTLEQFRARHAIARTAGDSTLDDQTQAAMLKTIIDESARLNDIIANLVFATRLESGAVALKKEWTTVEEVVGVGLSRHREPLSQRPFRVTIAPEVPMIKVDNAMLPQVVHNLIENALRYTAPGTPLGVSAWAREGAVVVKVWDEGPGLAEGEAVKVFERFYRGRASKGAGADAATHHATGMGLGLTICEGIIRAHDGRIWAEPNTPSGVAFMFSLPLDQPQPRMPVEDARDTTSPAPASGASP